MKSTLNHVGWVTENRAAFEDFWCVGLGFKQVWEASLMPEKVFGLFGLTDVQVTAVRYQKDADTIEIHVFTDSKNQFPLFRDKSTGFRRVGINHISLFVDDRDEFIKDLSTRVQYLEVRRFHDPSGWDNIFIRDYEGNWIELREDLTCKKAK